ncbi:MAG: radical SAM/SPASM domain-containing protein [Sphaerochaetaceae bacterium]|nr:radical SAM/SPASM domain-containing protein [Sphaerochaetaceae bacterium]
MIRNKFLKVIRDLNETFSNLAYNLDLTITGFPVGIMIEPTSNCNLRCALCPISKRAIIRNKSMLTLKEFKKIMAIPKYFCKYVTFWHFGEPFLNKELPEMINYLSKDSISTQVSTNGNVFEEKFIKDLLQSGLTKLIISVDTDNPKEYVKYRVGGDHKKLIENTKKIIALKLKLKSRTTIAIQFLITKENEKRINRLKKLAKKLNADEILVKPIGIGAAFKRITKSKKNFLPSNQNSRYNQNFYSKISPSSKCRYIWKRTVICSDGNVCICCRDQNSKYIIGNALIMPLFFIYNNEKIQKIRSKIRQLQSNELMCLRCHETQKTDTNINGINLRKQKQFNFILK